MKTEVVLRVHGVLERHVVNARNSHSAAGMVLQRLSPRVDRIRDVRIITIIGMPTGEVSRNFTGAHPTYQLK